MRKLLVIVAVLFLALAAVYVAAGFQPGPSITITKPGEFAGARIPIELKIDSPTPAQVQMFFEQNGTRTALREFDAPEGAAFTNVVASAAEVPGFAPKAGPATLIVSASRKVWGIRRVASEVSKPVMIRLEKPRVSVVSTVNVLARAR